MQAWMDNRQSIHYYCISFPFIALGYPAHNKLKCHTGLLSCISCLACHFEFMETGGLRWLRKISLARFSLLTTLRYMRQVYCSLYPAADSCNMEKPYASVLLNQSYHAFYTCTKRTPLYSNVSQASIYRHRRTWSVPLSWVWLSNLLHQLPRNCIVTVTW